MSKAKQRCGIAGSSHILPPAALRLTIEAGDAQHVGFQLHKHWLWGSARKVKTAQRTETATLMRTRNIGACSQRGSAAGPEQPQDEVRGTNRQQGLLEAEVCMRNMQQNVYHHLRMLRYLKEQSQFRFKQSKLLFNLKRMHVGDPEIKPMLQPKMAAVGRTLPNEYGTRPALAQIPVQQRHTTPPL